MKRRSAGLRKEKKPCPYCGGTVAMLVLLWLACLLLLLLLSPDLGWCHALYIYDPRENSRSRHAADDRGRLLAAVCLLPAPNNSAALHADPWRRLSCVCAGWNRFRSQSVNQSMSLLRSGQRRVGHHHPITKILLLVESIHSAGSMMSRPVCVLIGQASANSFHQISGLDPIDPL